MRQPCRDMSVPFASCVGVEYECTAVGRAQESKFTTEIPIFDELQYSLKLYEIVLERKIAL